MEFLDLENFYLEPSDEDEDKDNAKLNRPDVNAVQLGHWVTFKVCSTFNLALRSLDNSNVDESALFGKPRGFYPVHPMSAQSENKMPESELFNIGYSITSSTKQYITVPDVPYIKNIFDNRIMFSQRHVNDAFQNGYRVFQGMQYQDITRQYGGIVKIFDWQNNLLVVFENGVSLLPINERALIQTETGQSVHMYGAGVLPDKETPISVDYGSRWTESIIRTPVGIYGVDTEAKKIWRFTTNGFEIISDFKIGKFLNDNIKFDSDEHYPIIGLRNVKTHYDNYKGDLIFTFYDCTRTDTVDFNIVYNERINKWITRTSWTPLTSANINNIFISFDKDVAHEVALNAYSLKTTDISEGLVLNTNRYKLGDIGEITIKKYDYYDSYNKEFILEDKDKELFNIETRIENGIEKFYLVGLQDAILDSIILKIKVLLTKDGYSAPDFVEYVYIRPIDSDIFKSQYLYKHGFANLFEVKEGDSPKPLDWYGHPDKHKFEFEFIVNDTFYVQKIFNNLKIISNKTKPDEIQVWVNGDSYQFDSSIYFPTVQPIKDMKKLGRTKGNAQYKENIWDIEIKPFKHNNKEVRIRDKYVKIRVIYSGQDPAIITALQTFYTISYA